MIIFYTDRTSSRLNYTVGVIADAIGIEIKISGEKDIPAHIPQIHYGLTNPGTNLHIPAGDLLYSGMIFPQEMKLSSWEDLPTLFPMKGEVPFDLLSAVFFLVSRYEEYLPHTPDLYQRYPHTDSTAFRNGFLNIPLVNAWICKLIDKLNQKFGTSLRPRPFGFTPTYDIDMAWSYRNKGVLRNLFGFIRQPSIERAAVNLNLKQDPFYSFDFLESIHDNLDPVYFFLCAASTGTLDKNISPHNPRMKELIKEISVKYKTGLHPSWQSNEDCNKLHEEKNILEGIAGKIVLSRQHYLRFALPVTFRKLLAEGILHEYSMGYGTINGFRASISTPYRWYDLELEQETPLVIHPFCFMDANSYYEQKQDAETSYHELIHYLEMCRKYHCQMITIFHNNFLGSDRNFSGWKEMYTRFISRVQL